MLILLEAIYPIPLVNALQAVMLSYPTEPVTVMKDDPSVKEDPNSRTVVFMMNRDKKKIAPAVRQRCSQGYYVFALRPPSNGAFDPFQLTIQILGLLPKIVEILESSDIIEPGGGQFVHLLQLQNRQIIKIQLPPINPIATPLAKRKSVTRKVKHKLPASDTSLTIFSQ